MSADLQFLLAYFFEHVVGLVDTKHRRGEGGEGIVGVVRGDHILGLFCFCAGVGCTVDHVAGCGLPRRGREWDLHGETRCCPIFFHLADGLFTRRDVEVELGAGRCLPQAETC